MRSSRLATLLLALGMAVGAAAAAGLALGFEPARLPAALLNIAAYKLTFVAAFALLAAGAVVRRFARREEARTLVRRRADEAVQHAAPLASGSPLDGTVRAEPPAGVPVVEERRD